ncbi:hypothetical protein HispidOSU_007437 [Sigmodon hispidus]
MTTLTPLEQLSLTEGASFYAPGRKREKGSRSQARVAPILQEAGITERPLLMKGETEVAVVRNAHSRGETPRVGETHRAITEDETMNVATDWPIMREQAHTAVMASCVWERNGNRQWPATFSSPLPTEASRASLSAVPK